MSVVMKLSRITVDCNSSASIVCYVKCPSSLLTCDRDVREGSPHEICMFSLSLSMKYYSLSTAIGQIVSVGDPHKKYTKMEKIGQG